MIIGSYFKSIESWSTLRSRLSIAESMSLSAPVPERFDKP
jgi:hypothetical protein